MKRALRKMLLEKQAGVIALFVIVSSALVFVAPITVGEVSVRVEGVAALEPGEDLAKIRDEALRDAWRRAIEEGVGLVLRAESYALNYQAISDEIWTSTQGYIKEYKVIEENKDDSFYRVTISAEVDMLKLGQALDDLGIEIDRIGNPRIVVLMEEWNLGTTQPVSIAEAAIREAFCMRGFTVVEPEETVGYQQALHLAQNNAEAATEIAQALGADVAIVGDVWADPAGSIERGAFTWHAAMAFADVYVILRDTGETLTSVLVQETATKLTPELAGSEAIKKATYACIPQLIIETIAGLNYMSPNAIRALTLFVDGIESYSQALALKQVLGSLRELSQARLRRYGELLATFDLVYLGPAETLAQELESTRFTARLKELLGKGTSLVVRSIGFGTIEVALTTDGTK